MAGHALMDLQQRLNRFRLFATAINSLRHREWKNERITRLHSDKKNYLLAHYLPSTAHR
jgi:hypothetical protein